MNAAQDDISDKLLAKILGREIRLVREAHGWSRGDLVKQLPSRIGDRTLLSYEHGIRALTVTRLIEICRVLGVGAGEIIDRVVEKARDLRALSFHVSLIEVQQDRRPEFESVRLWAATRLNDGDTSVALAPVTVREMAAILGFSHSALAAYLVQFTTEDAAPD